MNATDIAFPNLGLYLENVPKSFSIFGFQIALYGVVIAIGVMAGVVLAGHICKLEKTDPDFVWDFIVYAIITCIIGARIYYVIFSWDMYKDNLLMIFNLREGGLAIYGAVIAAFLTLYIYCRIKRQSFLKMVDICVPGLVLGQAIGRWGNFFNREVFGEYTDNLLAMQLPVAAVRPWDISASLAAHITEGVNYIQVHPTFLYECLWNLCLLLVMMLYRSHKKFQGEIWLLYLGGYGVGRFWIEAIRTDQLYLTGTTIPVSQLLAFILVIVSVAADLFIRRKPGQIQGSKTETEPKESGQEIDK